MRKTIATLWLCLTLTIACFAGVIPQPEPCTGENCTATTQPTPEPPPVNAAQDSDEQSLTDDLFLDLITAALSLLP
ncbi:MAG TPA: hypothetical protein VF297_05015 [Pyrinomonadaceae bacterium]